MVVVIEVKRGEIYWVDWSPGRGSEQSGRRPGLVIQNNTGNHASSTIIVATCTTAENKPYPFLVQVSPKESGLPKDTFINLSHIITVDKIRLGGKCGELGKGKMYEVDRAIKLSLGIE